MLLQNTTQQKSTSVTEQKIMFYSTFKQTDTTPIYAEKKKEVLEEYQQQPQKKDGRHVKGKLCHTAHLTNESSSSIFNFHLQKAGRIASMQPRAVGGLPMKRSRGQTSTAIGLHSLSSMFTQPMATEVMSCAAPPLGTFLPGKQQHPLPCRKRKIHVLKSRF